jgi:hypothetical protein
MNVNISFGFYVSCNTNQGYIEVLNKKKINQLLKINNPIFFNINEYVDDQKVIIPFFMTNKMDDLYQIKKWNCFCYIYLNKTTNQCFLLYPNVIGIYTRSFSNNNLYQTYIERLFCKLKFEKYFDSIFNQCFTYGLKIYDITEISTLQNIFEFNLEPFQSINQIIDHKKLDSIHTVEDFREIEFLFYTIYNLEYKARKSDEKSSLITELKLQLNQKKSEVEKIDKEKTELLKQLNTHTKYVQEELNDFLLDVRKRLNDVELPVYEKKLVPEFNQTHCAICTELLSKYETVFVESSKQNPWDYSSKKEPIIPYIEVQDKFECGHLFHKDCIQAWLNTKKPESIYISETGEIVHCEDDFSYKTCPLCKGYVIRLIKWKPSEEKNVD